MQVNCMLFNAIFMPDTISLKPHLEFTFEWKCCYSNTNWTQRANFEPKNCVQLQLQFKTAVKCVLSHIFVSLTRALTIFEQCHYFPRLSKNFGQFQSNLMLFNALR